MYEHMERKQLLNSSAEQSRLLQEFPTVIPHVEELDKHGDEEGSPKSILMGTSEIPGDNWEGNGTFSDKKKHDGRVSIPKEKQHLTETSALKEPPQKTPIVAPKVPIDVFKIEPPRSFLEENQKCPKPFTSAPKDQSNDTLETEENQHSSSLSSTKQTKPTEFKRGKAKSEDPSIVQLIELSSDDDDDGGPHAAIGIQKLEDPESSIWYCLGPNGERKGPHSLSLLKRWSEYSSFALKFKVWKTSQSEENAILLGDAVKLGLGFPRKTEAGLS